MLQAFGRLNLLSQTPLQRNSRIAISKIDIGDRKTIFHSPPPRVLCGGRSFLMVALKTLSQEKPSKEYIGINYSEDKKLLADNTLSKTTYCYIYLTYRRHKINKFEISDLGSKFCPTICVIGSYTPSTQFSPVVGYHHFTTYHISPSSQYKSPPRKLPTSCESPFIHAISVYCWG